MIHRAFTEIIHVGCDSCQKEMTYYVLSGMSNPTYLLTNVRNLVVFNVILCGMHLLLPRSCRQLTVCSLQVQQEVSSRRLKEKKELIDAVKKFRKG